MRSQLTDRHPARSKSSRPSGLKTLFVTPQRVQGAFRALRCTLHPHPEWAPIGAAQFIVAVSDGVYDGTVKLIVPHFELIFNSEQSGGAIFNGGTDCKIRQLHQQFC